MPRLVAVLVAVAAALAGCGAEASGGDRPRLVVSAASSLKTAFTAYAERFRGADVRLSFAGSDELAAQVRRGVRPDVLASADARLAAALHAEGLVEEPVIFAANRIVLAVPAGSPVRGLADLTSPGTDLVVGAAGVPIGTYTREMLDRLPGDQGNRILARVRSNEPDVGGIVGKLVQGAADAGFVYATDVAAAGGALEAIELPRALQPRVAFAAAVVEGAGNPRQARAFVAGLVDDDGREQLRRAGFDGPPAR